MLKFFVSRYPLYSSSHRIHSSVYSLYFILFVFFPVAVRWRACCWRGAGATRRDASIVTSRSHFALDAWFFLGCAVQCCASTEYWKRNAIMPCVSVCVIFDFWEWEMLVSSGAGGPRAMLIIVALWLAEFGVVVTSSNVAWQENVRPKMYVQLGRWNRALSFAIECVFLLSVCALLQYCHLVDVSLEAMVSISPDIVIILTIFHYPRKRIYMDVNCGTWEFYISIL